MAPKSPNPVTVRLARSTVKFSSGSPSAARVCMLSAPTSKPAARPVRRPPPTMGTSRPPESPMRREWKRVKSRSELPAR